MANSFIYAEEWATKLQERLTEPTKFKEICNVEYTNTRVLHNPYLTEATVQTGTRGTAYTMQDVTETDESVTINTYKVLAQFIDRADLAQSTFLKQMDLADKQGILLNEAIESALYADYAALTTFDNTELGGAAGNITVSATNIDDIVRAIRRKIVVAGGATLMEQNGVFIVWRPTDLELLEAYAQANGFNTADQALRNGVMGSKGFDYLGVTHYSSNLLTAGHVIAGVKKTYQIGIVKDTYGQIVETKDPLNLSGVGIVSRVDYKGKAWTKVVPVLFNVTVA